MFLILVFMLAGLIFFTIRQENRKDWKNYRLQYVETYKAKLNSEIEKAEQDGDQQKIEKFRNMIEDAAQKMKRERIHQIFLPDADVRDLCMTCHIALKNPYFAESKNPLRTHPKAILASHEPRKFGCTLCHHGQGVALEEAKAHGYEKNWLSPRVPGKYIQGLCLGCHDNTYGLKGAEKAEKGRRLFMDNGCYGCHKARGMVGLPFMAPPLDSVGSKVKDAGWMLAWLENPSSVRTQTRMPRFRLKGRDAADIAARLMSWKKDGEVIGKTNYPKGSRRKGKQLFAEKGCIGCHSVTSKEGSLTKRVPNLSAAGLKLFPDWIMTWIEKPSGLSPDTAMPKMMIEKRDINHIGRYIAALEEKEISERLAEKDRNLLTTASAEEGERLIKHYGCYGCHSVSGMKDLPLVGVDVSSVAEKRLEEFPFGNSDVKHTKWDWLYHKIMNPDIYTTSDMPLKMPDYAKEGMYDKTDAEAMTVFYLYNKKYDIPEGYHYKSADKTMALKEGDYLVTHFNCQGCHQLDEKIKPRIEPFADLKSMVPPRLIGEGERVQPQWFFQYLSNPNILRPWLKTRMPTFNLDYHQKEAIIDYFTLIAEMNSDSKVNAPYVLLPIRSDYDDETIEMGEYRVVTDKCMQCHPVSMDETLPEDIKLEDLSINLMLSKTRLRYDWIIDFLRDPDRFAGKGTKMPFVYYTPDKVPRIPDPEMWIRYTALYLMFMDKIPEMKKEESIEAVRPGSETDWTSY